MTDLSILIRGMLSSSMNALPDHSSEYQGSQSKVVLMYLELEKKNSLEGTLTRLFQGSNKTPSSPRHTYTLLPVTTKLEWSCSPGAAARFLLLRLPFLILLINVSHMFVKQFSKQDTIKSIKVPLTKSQHMPVFNHGDCTEVPVIDAEPCPAPLLHTHLCCQFNSQRATLFSTFPHLLVSHYGAWTANTVLFPGQHPPFNLQPLATTYESVSLLNRPVQSSPPSTIRICMSQLSHEFSRTQCTMSACYPLLDSYLCSSAYQLWNFEQDA